MWRHREWAVVTAAKGAVSCPSHPNHPLLCVLLQTPWQPISVYHTAREVFSANGARIRDIFYPSARQREKRREREREKREMERKNEREIKREKERVILLCGLTRPAPGQQMKQRWQQLKSARRAFN